EPDVSVRQAEPEVSVQQGEPEVSVRQGEPSVSVGQQSEQQRQGVQQEERQAASQQQDRIEQQQSRQTTEFTTDLDPQELVGNNVVTPDGDDLGEISGVARSRADDDMHALIDVGGFLGIGERTVALPLDRLERNQDGDIVTRMSREELEQLP